MYYVYSLYLNRSLQLVQNRSMEQIVPINVAQTVSTLRVIT